MRVDRNLNLVLTVDLEGGGVAHVHSVPIGRDVFETYFMTLSRVYAAMTEEGGEWLIRMGPRTAALLLKRVAIDGRAWEGEGGVEKGLLSEITRLSNVVVPVAAGGWDQIPLADVRRLGLLTEEDLSEVMNAIVFFIVCWWGEARAKRAESLTWMMNAFGAQVTSSNVTEWQTSLQTSTTEENTGATEAPYSIPS